MQLEQASRTRHSSGLRTCTCSSAALSCSRAAVAPATSRPSFAAHAAAASSGARSAAAITTGAPSACSVGFWWRSTPVNQAREAMLVKASMTDGSRAARQTLA